MIEPSKSGKCQLRHRHTAYCAIQRTAPNYYTGVTLYRPFKNAKCRKCTRALEAANVAQLVHEAQFGRRSIHLQLAKGVVGVAQHRNAVCLFALRTWQSRRASGCSVTPESPVVQGSACGRLHCANTSGSTNCRQRLLSLSERRHGIAIGAGLHALVPVDAGATEVSAEASRGNARCKPQALRIRCSETADIPAHLCRHRLRFLGFAHPKQAVGRAESTLLACAGAAHERTALPLATSTGEDVRCGACLAARRERRSTDH